MVRTRMALDLLYGMRLRSVAALADRQSSHHPDGAIFAAPLRHVRTMVLAMCHTLPAASPELHTDLVTRSHEAPDCSFIFGAGCPATRISSPQWS
jgi:hypothetical protein